MEYFTIDREAFGELEAKGSRFLAHLVPIERFETRLDELRAQHRKANHHVTASRRIDALDRLVEQASDDGEPAGTSGRPTLRVLEGAQLVQAGVIITRYFGGTKLGTGGLARAYSGAAAQAIKAAKLRPWQRLAQAKLHVPVAMTDEIERIVASAKLAVLSRDFDPDGGVLLIEGPEKTLHGIEWPRGIRTST